jgi:hypothetical protein
MYLIGSTRERNEEEEVMSMGLLLWLLEDDDVGVGMEDAMIDG